LTGEALRYGLQFNDQIWQSRIFDLQEHLEGDPAGWKGQKPFVASLPASGAACPFSGELFYSGFTPGRQPIQCRAWRKT
jgi:hypothetical protein